MPKLLKSYSRYAAFLSLSMDNRFAKLFGLTEADAIALLDKPQSQLGEQDSRYVAASQLANFPTENSIQALMRAVERSDSSLDNHIVRRKSVESLGRLRATQALSAISNCLAEHDCYTVEVAVWAIGEIGTQDGAILAAVTQLLDKPGQVYRVIIHTLAKLNYRPALESIHQFVDAADKPTASAAMAAVCRFTGDYTLIPKVVSLLQHPNVNARRASLQDLIDARYYPALPNIARCPVSLVFRLRAIRLLAEAGISSGELTFADIQPSLEQVLRDHPRELDLVHEYDQPPALAFAVRELYQTDFGRCYLGSKTLLDLYPEVTPEALLATYREEAHNDYGAHYHVIKLLGWLRYAPSYDLLVETLHNPAPQFQKSRVAAAIALGELGDKQAIPELQSSLKTGIWSLQYAALMALEQLDAASGLTGDTPDWLVQARAAQIPVN